MVLIPWSHSPQKSTDNANSTRMYISLLFQIHESMISAFAFQYFILTSLYSSTLYRVLEGGCMCVGGHRDIHYRYLLIIDFLCKQPTEIFFLVTGSKEEPHWTLTLEVPLSTMTAEIKISPIILKLGSVNAFFLYSPSICVTHLLSLFPTSWYLQILCAHSKVMYI